MSDLVAQASAGPRTDLPVPTRGRWQPLRAGIQNLWQYEDRCFVFHRGRLLLRGRNEVGKSKALELLLPFLLDADLSPHRLDPFGSASRQMKWNLLNEENPQLESNVGYVWLELGRAGEGGPEYLTLGAGLKARRSAQPVDAWYFITGLRPGEGLQLLDASRTLPSRRRLEGLLGPDGRLFDRKTEYRREVNLRLFDMPDRQYDAMIETLLQLRRPQLAKQLEPAALSQILTQSLPPLDPDVIGRLAEGFERLDRHRIARDEWDRTSAAVARFLGVYRRYVLAFAKARARRLTQGESQYQAARSAVRKHQDEAEQVRRRLEEAKARVESLDDEARALETRHETLLGSDEYRAAEDLDRADREASTRKDEVRRAKTTHQRALDDRAKAEADRDAAAEQRALASTQLERLHAAAEDAARRAVLQEAHAGIAGLARALDLDGARSTLDLVLDRRARHVELLQRLQDEVTTAEEQVRSAKERATAAAGHHADTVEQIEEANRALEQATDRLEEAVRRWIAGLSVIDLSESGAAALVDAPAVEQLRLAQEAAGKSREVLQKRRTDLSVEHEDQTRNLDAAREEHRALLAAPHPEPSAPAWRTADRGSRENGAPLYLLCEFGRTISEATRLAVEGALEASGLLDAWVTPDGDVLGAGTFDLLLRATGEAAGRATLADVMDPTPTGGVASATVRAVLAQVAFVAPDAAPSGAAWVAADGRFGLGPLYGEYRKDELEYVGATAREAARQRRLAVLASRISQLEVAVAENTSRLDEVAQRLQRLESELAAFPSRDDVIKAEAEVGTAVRAEADARARMEAAKTRLSSLEAERDSRLAERDRQAADLGLSGWSDSLRDLRDATARYGESAKDLLSAARELLRCQEVLDGRQEQLDSAELRTVNAQRDRDHADEEAKKARAHADALRERAGATREEVRATLEELATRRAAVRRESRAAREQHGRLNGEQGRVEQQLADAQASVEARDLDRVTAKDGLVRLARSGILAVPGLDIEQQAADWSITDALAKARAIQNAAGDVPFDDESIDKAADRVVEGHGRLMRDVTQGVRVTPRHEDGALVYDVMLNGQVRTLLSLRDEIAADVAERDRLLAHEENELFESFLAGETHEHLRERLNDAHAMVDRMNKQLKGRVTAGGMVLRLAWNPDPSAPAGTPEALDLLLHSPSLLAKAQREALSTFLKRRLDSAREDEAGGSLQARMLHALDYRQWYQFVVEQRTQTGVWKRVTKKVHGAGSGGQKAVMLHLPLFAAAAAFYESARAPAPRLVLLDEAFAGIDRPMRAQLMGLLAEFDLDFVMTSFEEWGFYAELDGLATYQLTREPGFSAVLAERFLWDGATVHDEGVV